MHFVNEFPRKLEELAMEAWRDLIDQDGKQLANLFKDDLIKLVRSQREPWPPLNPSYKTRKQKLGLDTRTLIASGNYLKSLRAIRSSMTKWTVEPPDRILDWSRLSKKRPRITYKQLAATHEFGSPKNGVPARPHWSVMHREYINRSPEFHNLLQKSFERRLQKKLVKLFSGIG